MKHTYYILMTLFVGILVLTGIIVLLFETDILIAGMAVGNAQKEFVMTIIMELLTLGQIWLALRLFKFKMVKQDLIARKEVALRKWGILRLLLLAIPMLFNALFYEIFLNTTFGYLAIILLFCQPFVYPSLARCEAEVTPENKEEQ